MESEIQIGKMLNDEEKGIIAYRDNSLNEIFYNDRINILDELESMKLNTWEKVKRKMTGLYGKPDTTSLFFLSHKEDEITGKPQLIEQHKKSMALCVKTKTQRPGGYEEDKIGYRFFDESVDKRDRAIDEEVLSRPFYVYKVIDNDKEYIVFSENKLIPDLYTFRGMKVILKDNLEISNTLKFKNLQDVFIAVEEVKAIKVLDKERLIKHIQNLKEKYNLDKDSFIEYLFTRKNNKIYPHTEDYNKLILSFLFSGKEEYPLHLLIFGRAGTGKTFTIEALHEKFKEIPEWFSCELSTIKGLIPSFREKPAKPGFILDCVRVSLIDELLKIIEKDYQTGTYTERLTNYLGSLNSLLEHKDTTAGTGNDTIRVKNTSKSLFMTNPYKSYRTIYEHIETIGKTTLGRVLPFVQTDEERALIDRKEIRKNTNKLMTNEEFLTIYDTCQSFLIDYDEGKVREIFLKTLQTIKEPMKEVWKSRGEHHSLLLLDGLVKVRCLFDEDKTFKATEEDYKELENMLNYIIKSWDCLLMPWERGDTF